MIVQDMLVCDLPLQLFYRSGVDTLLRTVLGNVSRTRTPQDSGPTCLDLCGCLTCRVALSPRKGQRYDVDELRYIRENISIESFVIADGSD